MSESIPHVHQNISEADIEAVARVLRSDWLTQGPMVSEFESAVSSRSRVRYGVAVNSATSALHIACLALGVGPGDTVWTSPNTFVASANCARYCGAEVDFVDIAPDTWCLSVECLQAKLEHNRSKGLPLPKVVIPVHLSGHSCDMCHIAELGQQFGFRIIEDAAHAIGGSYCNEPVGNCRYSDITVFSFHPVKIVTTGEGGMGLTNDPVLHERMACLRTHGITREPQQMVREPNGPWYYEQLCLGFNYRMTDFQASLGLSQLERLEQFITRRNELAQRYDEALMELPIRRQVLPEGVRSARHLYIIRVNSERHKYLYEALRGDGIGVNLHYMPVHLQPYYRNLGFREGSYPESEAHGREAISLPLFPSMTNEHQDLVISKLKDLF